MITLRDISCNIVPVMLQPKEKLLGLYVATYRFKSQADWHWTLLLTPEAENLLSWEKSMCYEILYDSEKEERYYHQSAKSRLAVDSAVAKVFLGRVVPAHRAAIELLLADPRHLRKATSSREWVRAVLTVLTSGEKLKTDVPIDVNMALSFLESRSARLEEMEDEETEVCLTRTIKYSDEIKGGRRALTPMQSFEKR